MKISVLTPTYNRAGLLNRLYTSLIINSKYNIEIEWLIMNDGSTDATETLINEFISEKIIDIKYYKQENAGKMQALNELMKYVTGDLVVECDSDDYFTEDAFETINKAYEESTDSQDLYALCFLKYDQEGKNIGQDFKKEKTTMFDLYFKDGEDGEKSLVFYKDKRINYSYELENNEKFITEARMHHKMDLDYYIKCYNKPIMICEYQKDGYTKNIKKIFKNNPYGYFKYFREIFDHDMQGVSFKKRLYVIKHYILFGYLTKNKLELSYIKGFLNKLLILILYIPGRIKSRIFNKGE